MLLRKGLHARGLRYRLHPNDVPGKPDLVFPHYKAAILIHGCFWHGHECHLFKWPSTRAHFWRTKLEANKRRDGRALAELHAAGWRALVVWECTLRGRLKRPINEILGAVEYFIKNDINIFKEIGGAHRGLGG